MKKRQVIKILEKKSPAVLLQLLESAYDVMNAKQRGTIFGECARQSSVIVNGPALLKKVKKFHEESLKGAYYAPFAINSHNFSDIPEETEEWFERLGELLEDSSKLARQGDHAKAVQCFRLLYELIEGMERGKEIIFADEYGSWMIPGDEKKFIKAYISSLAAIATPEEYTAAAVPLIKRDSYQSFFTRAYSVAVRAANKDQRARLQAEVERLKIRTQSKSS